MSRTLYVERLLAAPGRRPAMRNVVEHLRRTLVRWSGRFDQVRER